MLHRSFCLATVALLLAPAPLLAQRKPAARPPTQQVIPPKTVYWLSAATTSGFMMGAKPPSSGDMMRMAMGGGMGGTARTLNLDLGSRLPPTGSPAATHAIPPSMAMGPSLALKTPPPARAGTVSREPEDFERPKGRILLFWGCGETARPGQPVVIDFANLAAGQIPPGLFAGERIRIARPPSPTTWPTYGGWPNDDRPSREAIPAGASLVGAHSVSGNYPPKIDFTLAQDWMAGLALQQAKAPSGALNLSWNTVPGTTAHFAQMFGASEDSRGNDPTIVFWSSSELQTFMSGLSDYIAPAEAARLVGTRQLMPAAQASCTIPREAMQAAPSGMITLVAHGPEQNFVHPPRPADPRTPWVQEWTVKARFVSRTGGIAGMDMADMGGDDARRPARRTRNPANCVPAASASDAVSGVLGGAIGGLFGSRRKPPVCEEE